MARAYAAILSGLAAMLRAVTKSAVSARQRQRGYGN